MAKKKPLKMSVTCGECCLLAADAVPSKAKKVKPDRSGYFVVAIRDGQYRIAEHEPVTLYSKNDDKYLEVRDLAIIRHSLAGAHLCIPPGVYKVALKERLDGLTMSSPKLKA